MTKITKIISVSALVLALSMAYAAPSKADWLGDLMDSIFSISVDFNGAGNSGGGSSVVSVTGGSVCFNDGVVSSGC